MLAAPLGIFAGTDLPDMSGAFAPVADTATPVYGDVKIETDWVIDAKGCIAVKVYFVEAIDLKSWDMKLTYDADIFDFADKAGGADAQQIYDNCNPSKNALTDESNPSVDGKIEGGGYFKDVLWPAEDFLAAFPPPARNALSTMKNLKPLFSILKWKMLTPIKHQQPLSASKAV